METSRTLKVASLQYTPVYKDVKESMAVADKLIADLTEDDGLDVILLPEMAFTGYKFDDKDDIRPFGEVADKGTTFEWCSATAQKLKCYVFGGYPEILDDSLYNSQLVVDPEGTFIKSYK